MFHTLPTALRLLLACFVWNKSVPDESHIEFQLRHSHSISNQTRIIFSDVSQSIQSLETYSVQTRPVVTHRALSFSAFTSARMRSMFHQQSEPLLWTGTEIAGPDTQRRETLLALAKMTANSYCDSPDKDWYELGPEWNTVWVTKLHSNASDTLSLFRMDGSPMPTDFVVTYLSLLTSLRLSFLSRVHLCLGWVEVPL